MCKSVHYNKICDTETRGGIGTTICVKFLGLGLLLTITKFVTQKQGGV